MYGTLLCIDSSITGMRLVDRSLDLSTRLSEMYLLRGCDLSIALLTERLSLEKDRQKCDVLCIDLRDSAQMLLFHPL